MKDQLSPTMSIIYHHSPLGLYRIIGIFVRRNIQIEHLSMHIQNSSDMAQLTLVVKLDSEEANKISNLIKKIIEVEEVNLR